MRVVRHTDVIWETRAGVNTALVHVANPSDVSSLPAGHFRAGLGDKRMAVIPIQNGSLNNALFTAMGYGDNTGPILSSA